MSAYTNAQTSFHNYISYHHLIKDIPVLKNNVRRESIQFARIAVHQDDVSLVLEAMASLVRARKRYMTHVEGGRVCMSIMEQGAESMAHHMIDRGAIRLTQEGTVLWWDQEVGNMEELPNGTYHVVIKPLGENWPIWTYTTADNWRRSLDLFAKGQLVAAGYALFHLCNWSGWRG